MTTTNRTVLVTGATDGLGRGVANRLAADGATVLLHGRDGHRLDDVATQIAETTGIRPPTLRAELADLEQVRNLAAQVREATDTLDVLVNNAGIGSGLPESRARQTSADGHELRFAVNYLAGFLLTLELLPLLQASTPARVVNVASLGQSALDFDDLMLEQRYDGSQAYGQSKLAQIMFTVELAARLDASHVTVNALHPGTYMPTKMVLEERGSHVDSLETGIDATVRLVVDDALAGVTGRFFDRQQETSASGQATNASARRQLWDRSMELTGAQL